MEILSEETWVRPHLLTYVMNWLRVVVISGSYVVDKNNNYHEYTMKENSRWYVGDKTEGNLLSISSTL